MKNLPSIVFVGLLMLAGASSHRAQGLSNAIVVDENVLVSGDAPTRPHVEPCIAADPADAKHLIASTIAFTRPDAWFTVAVFTSFDSGRHWRRGKLEGVDGFSFVGDAWTAFGARGVAFLCCIGSSKSNASILVFRSTDGGRAWSKPTTIPFGGGGPFDRCSIVADTSSSSKFASYVYVLASQSLGSKTGPHISPAAVSRSTDDGVTFSDPVRVVPNNLDGNVANPVVLSDGTLVVTFFDFASMTRDRMRLLKQRRLWVAASRDGGLTFSIPSFVTEFADPDAATHPRSGPNRMLAVDRSSGPLRDRLYMVWTDFQSGGTDIYLSYSIDQGETWSDPLRVNDDVKKLVDHATPAIAVNGDGVVGVAWYDRRNDSANKCFEISFAASVDGGKTLLPNVRVSTVKSCPDVPGNVVRPDAGGDGFGVAARWPAGGDYSGLAASADGLFHILWSDSRTGVYQNWTATVRVTPNASQSTGDSSVAYPALREELLKRLERDQAIRTEWMKKAVNTHDSALEARMGDIDSSNTARMKQIVKQFGWPGPDLVGEDGRDAAFILVQHADYQFQKEMLPLVREAYKADKLPGQFYALLLDRVLVAEGKPQVYGTQAKGRGQIRDYAWSPRGNHLAFSMPNDTGFNSIYIWSAGDGQLHKVTDESFNANGPAWDPQGNYLYYLSNREFAPQISSIEFNYALNRSTGIFAVALRKDVKSPFPPESDEVTITKEEADKPKDAEKPKEPEKKDAAPKPPADLVIDFDGLGSRVAKVPVEANNYSGLSVKTGHLLYSVGSAFYYGRQGEKPPSLRIYAIKERKETTLVEDSRGWVLSDDGSKVLVAGPGGSSAMYDATPQGTQSRKPVSTAGLAVDRVPAEEWNQIFNEAWRRYRDFFYVPNMHGYDWEALREQYKPLLKYVAHRSDLNYIIGEMISELTVQHAYVEGGDFQIPPRPRAGLPGARFELDQKAGRYKIARIFPGQNEEDTYRSPLTEIGVNVSVGDYVLAINGEELKADDDPYRLLKNKADSVVQLTVNKEPTMTGARTVSYRPITNESDLIYLDWVTANRKKVSDMTGGRVGYIHIPDMGAPGIREFIKWYYGQITKEGLVVDVRANGGGNVSQMLIERLRRKVLALNYSRTVDEASTYPGGTFIGPMAALLNENSASDGDIFPAMFREAGLGPLIGKRSWGGVIGIGNRGTLIDGGTIFVPESAFASSKGQWIIEGYGVDPDIEVENDPKSLIEGKDPQLDRAVAEIMKKLKDKPVKLPPRPAAPVKTPDAKMRP